jgi:hypothetical protein
MWLESLEMPAQAFRTDAHSSNHITCTGVSPRVVCHHTGAAGDDELADILDELDAAVLEAGTGGAGGAGAGRGAQQQQARTYPSGVGLVGQFAPKPKKPQGPIHPGSTPEEDGQGNEAAAHFLAYNSLGELMMLRCSTYCMSASGCSAQAAAACRLLG